MGEGRKKSKKSAAKDQAAAVEPAEAKPAFSKVDQDILSYLKDIPPQLEGLKTNPEERSLLCANVLDEALAKDAAVVISDATCSRILEQLLSGASAEAVCNFARIVITDSGFIQLVNHAIGSHVMERLFDSLGAAAVGTDEAFAKEATQSLLSASQAIGGALYDVITDQFGSHVARKLLSVAVGHNIAPHRGAFSGSDQSMRNDSASGDAPKTGLAAKVETEEVKEVEARPPKLPDVLVPITEAILAEALAESLGAELASHPYASPFLQALLVAMKHDTAFQETVLPRIMGMPEPESMTPDKLHALFKDRTTSHLMEVVVQTAPFRTRKAMQQRGLRDHLVSLAEHPIANFVVQALIASIRKEKETKWVVKELAPVFPSLLRSRRGGVVAATLALVARTGIGYQQVAPALLQALKELPDNKQGHAPALLTLDMGCTLEEVQPGRRLSTLGCTMLIPVLKFPRELAMPFTTSIAEMSPEGLVRTATDAGGSRVLETFLTRAKNANKLRKTVMRKLQGSYAATAAYAPGGFLVERVFTVGNTEVKERVAEELAAASARIAEYPWGGVLLNRCAVEEFKRDAESWRKRFEKAKAVKAEFDELLSPAAAAGAKTPPSGKKTKPAKRDREARLSEGAIADMIAGGAASVPSTDGNATKRQKTADAAGVEQDSTESAEGSGADGETPVLASSVANGVVTQLEVFEDKQAGAQTPVAKKPKPVQLTKTEAKLAKRKVRKAAKAIRRAAVKAAKAEALAAGKKPKPKKKKISKRAVNPEGSKKERKRIAKAEKRQARNAARAKQAPAAAS